jgi:mRNA interferase RelE/StbE
MNIIIQPRAKKELKAFPKLVIEQILKKLYSIRDNPLDSIERLKGYYLWKLRIGDYRAILYVDTGKQNIHVVKVGHRKNVYNKL